MGGDHFLNLQPGTIVNGRYEVVKCLGTGSMGMVYACRHRELAGHIVAMKVLFAEVARDEVAAARFRNEIVASYGVSHPNVVRAYEYFRDGDLIAFTMEYIGGGDLADRVGSAEEIPISECIEMLCQMASGVQAIHDAGIIHRDLKPENILITAQGDVKITDFGIARTGTGPKLTEHGGVVGTIDYVSPEYLERGQVDRRSDIYALGILAYEMLTGRAPFKGKSLIETMTLRLRTDPEPPHHLRSDCPVPLSNIILKAMAREPEERYQQSNEMLEDLESLKRSRMGLRGSGTQPRVAGERRAVRERPVHASESISSGTLEGLTFSSEADRSTNYAAAPAVGTSAVRAALSGSRPRLNTTGEVPSGSSVYLGSGAASSYRGSQASLLDERLNPSVSVSQSRLSTQRIQELSFDLNQPNRGTVQTLLFRILILFVGFGVGMLALKQVKPSFFSDGTEKETKPQIDLREGE